MNKQTSLPSEQEEIHLITSTGKTVFICETVERAVLYWQEMLPPPTDWKVVRVTIMKDDITPAIMDPRRAPKSAMLRAIAKEQGIPVIDIPLAIAS